MRTVKDKFEYNKKQQKNDFSRGYVDGVEMFKRYPKLSIEDKKQQSIIIDAHKAMAAPFKSQFSELSIDGDSYSKGVLCAYRDCANELKKRKK